MYRAALNHHEQGRSEVNNEQRHYFKSCNGSRHTQNQSRKSEAKPFLGKREDVWRLIKGASPHAPTNCTRMGDGRKEDRLNAERQLGREP